ncbi:MAG: Ig-like domain-containing protein, partial [Muribaculaceae bacterium]|nr:Ig-like domain-containing protein [Muribaculaceae bacterium]
TVATVDDAGKVTAVKEGTATITASCGKQTASCTVTVAAKVIEVNSITLDKTELSLTEGESETLTATVAPNNATDNMVTWKSDDETVATVDKDGKVTAVKEGTATITASCGEHTATCAVTVAAKVILVTGIILDKTELSLTEGDTATLTATVIPDNATDKSVTWISSDSTIASVDSEGNVTAINAGTAIITAVCGNIDAICVVNVGAKYVEPEIILAESLTVSPDSWSGVEGSSFKITATVLPENTTDKSISWESSDINIASVDEEGVVTVLEDGTCVITVSTLDGSNLKAECSITVLSGTSGIGQVFATADSRVDVYGMNGALIKQDCTLEDVKHLQPAIYILRQENGKTIVFNKR